MSVKRPVLKFTGIALGIALFVGVATFVIRPDREPVRDAFGHVTPCPVCEHGRANIHKNIHKIIERAQFWKGRTITGRNGCCAALKQLDGAVMQWALENKKRDGDPVDRASILVYLKGSSLPVCKAGGNYSVSTVGAMPECSLGTICSQHTCGRIRIEKAGEEKAKK